MKLPEDEQKAYEHYKDDLHYQASMFESSFGDGYHEGKVIGVQEGIELGAEQATKKLVLNMIQQGVSIETIATMTGLSITAIEELLT
jgi:predicted transposase/invertase (TIGR01784 family)